MTVCVRLYERDVGLGVGNDVEAVLEMRIDGESSVDVSVDGA